MTILRLELERLSSQNVHANTWAITQRVPGVNLDTTNQSYSNTIKTSTEVEPIHKHVKGISFVFFMVRSYSSRIHTFRKAAKLSPIFHFHSPIDCPRQTDSFLETGLSSLLESRGTLRHRREHTEEWTLVTL